MAIRSPESAGTIKRLTRRTGRPVLSLAVTTPASHDAGMGGDNHNALARLAGTWAGRTRAWFEPGVLADESGTRGRIRSVLDGRFVVHEYEGSLKGKPLMGMAILGYHVDAGRYTMAWVDSFHMGTATMHAQGESTSQGFQVLGHYDVPQSPPWGWRTEFALEDGGQRLIITAYNISPGGLKEGAPGDKAVETVYTRIG